MLGLNSRYIAPNILHIDGQLGPQQAELLSGFHVRHMKGEAP